MLNDCISHNPVIAFELPLPPSKNRRTTRTARGIIVVTREVKKYRSDVALLIKQFKGLLPDRRKIVVQCNWFKTNTLQDCPNFHDELCDAIFPALELNDRFALVRDLDYDIDQKNPRVEVRMWAF